jgi:hypothetical protein
MAVMTGVLSGLLLAYLARRSIRYLLGEVWWYELEYNFKKGEGLWLAS